MADLNSALNNNRDKNLYGQETNTKLRKLNDELCALKKIHQEILNTMSNILDRSGISVLQSKLCLLDGSLINKRVFIDLSTFNNVIVKYYNEDETLYTGNINNLSEMNCCNQTIINSSSICVDGKLWTQSLIFDSKTGLLLNTIWVDENGQTVLALSNTLIGACKSSTISEELVFIQDAFNNQLTVLDEFTP